MVKNAPFYAVTKAHNSPGKCAQAAGYNSYHRRAPSPGVDIVLGLPKSVCCYTSSNSTQIPYKLAKELHLDM